MVRKAAVLRGERRHPEVVARSATLEGRRSHLRMTATPRRAPFAHPTTAPFDFIATCSRMPRSAAPRARRSQTVMKTGGPRPERTQGRGNMAEHEGTRISRRDLVGAAGAGTLAAMVGADAILSRRAPAAPAP